MEYSINKLSKMAGVSTRTLRYYDEIGLLTPQRVTESGYRVYGELQVDALQQILFYRALGVELLKIKEFLYADDFDKTKSLESHLIALLEKRAQLDALIQNASRTISAMKGETTMTDKEKFEGFKQKMLEENERKYGTELEEKYGRDRIDASNARIKEMTFERYSEAEQLEAEIETALTVALQDGNPAGELAQKVCALHEKWLRVYNPQYTKEYHREMGELYVADERFTAYYDKIAPGCAIFLRDAITIYCK